MFKAKSVETGNWVEGYYAYYSQTILKDNLHMIILGGNFQEWQEIDPKTLCQYTGLKDINGRRIYEGDLVKPITFHPKDKPYKPYRVEWNEYGYLLFNGETGFDSSEVEVVGNIYDMEDTES